MSSSIRKYLLKSTQNGPPQQSQTNHQETSNRDTHQPITPSQTTATTTNINQQDTQEQAMDDVMIVHESSGFDGRSNLETMTPVKVDDGIIGMRIRTPGRRSIGEMNE